MTVSVVIPTYNRGALIAETLDSILRQTSPPDEVIVVDDGSTDHTEAVVRRYAGVIYRRIGNSGVCRARNVGVELSRMEWVAFCDSDDLWKPNKLEEHARCLQAAPEAEYQFTNFYTFGGDGPTANKFDDLPEDYWAGARAMGPGIRVIDRSFYPKIFTRQPIFQSTILMSRAFFDRVGGYDESLGRTKSEDLEFTLRCVQSGVPIGVLHAPLAGIRKHARNFSGDQLELKLGEIAILRHALKWHPAAAECAGLIRGSIASRSRIAADLAFERGSFDVMAQTLCEVPRESWPVKLRIKAAVAGMPAPIARASWKVATLLTRASRWHPGSATATE